MRRSALSLQNQISDLGGDLTDIKNSLSAAADKIAEQQAAYELALANLTSTQSTTPSETPSTPITGTGTSSAPPPNNNTNVSEALLGNISGISIQNSNFNK
jgi:hypothetical protein